MCIRDRGKPALFPAAQHFHFLKYLIPPEKKGTQYGAGILFVDPGIGVFHCLIHHGPFEIKNFHPLLGKITN